MTGTHAKERIALRHWLLGRQFYTAAEAMTWAENHHSGLRKDGVTPEFNHQVQITLYLASLTPHLRYPEATLTVGLIHDVAEDYDVEFSEITHLFGQQVAESTHALTKVHKGIKRNPDEVKAAQEKDPVASVVKGGDRIHNQSTMAGVFTPQKMLDYIDETEQYILPMLKSARRAFPSQDGAYQNERVVLRTQNTTLRHLANALTAANAA